MADKSKQPLFNEFPPVSTQEWMNKITADLKGADFDKKLVWKTNEGFNIRPFYRAEDLEPINYLDSLPGEFPFVRGIKPENSWLVRQNIIVNEVLKANQKALDLISKGVNSIGFIFDDDKILTPENIKTLLQNINNSAIEVNFETRNGNEKLLLLVIDELKSKNKNIENIKGSLNFDPIGNLTIGGKICETVEKSMDYVAEIVREGKKLPLFQVVNVNGKNFGNAGSTIVQELAFSLSVGNEYLSQLTKRGISVNDAAKTTRFNLSVGSNYFMEIAKLRAARLLWATIVNEYKPTSKDACRMLVHCQTSEFNKTVYDPNVNMLRTQTEAMSAVIGGCHSLTVDPFDNIFTTPTAFSERIARNQQLLLKEESYFDKIADPSGGSYYIESLTDSIANEAWKLFIEIENAGGYLSALNKGVIQKYINESALLRRKAIASRKEVLLGTNQYPNTQEFMKNSINKNDPGVQSSGNQIIEPVKIFRASEEFEILRLEVEKAPKRPKVFMLTYGHLAMRLARSQFSGNFFGCAGYEIVDNLGFASVEDGVVAAIKANANIVVLCSSDEEYAEAAPVAFKKLGGKAIFVVAGAPACTEDLKAQGIENFINIKSNVLETLQKFNKLLLF